MSMASVFPMISFCLWNTRPLDTIMNSAELGSPYCTNIIMLEYLFKTSRLIMPFSLQPLPQISNSPGNSRIGVALPSICHLCFQMIWTPMLSEAICMDIKEDLP